MSAALGVISWITLFCLWGINQAIIAPALVRRVAISWLAEREDLPSAPMMIEAKGHGGQVTFDGDFLTIHRKGFLARSTSGKGEKRIPLASIAAVQWKPAGAMTNGFIQFTVPGGNEARGRFGSQTTSAAQDENSVLFTKAQMPEFEQLRVALEQAIAERARGPVAPAAPPASAAEQIAQLAQLHQAGALSDEEFSAAKARLLGL